MNKKGKIGMKLGTENPPSKGERRSPHNTNFGVPISYSQARY